MATPEQQAAQAAHQALVEERDIHSIHKTFRNPAWKPNNRRNKNVKTILGEASRREASALATPQENNSGMSSRGGGGGGGNDDDLSTSGASTPAAAAAAAASNSNNNSNSNSSGLPPNLAQASQSLSKLVLDKNHNKTQPQQPLTASGTPVFGSGAPAVTYTNIESAPSLAPQRRYCDITGLSGPYTDPKTRLRYHNSEVFGVIRGFQQGVAEQYLEMRNAHTVLK